LVCSGKIFYELLQSRNELDKTDVAIVRLEQFYPFPESQLKMIFQKYGQAKKWFWVQEEPQNMGGWQFVQPRIRTAGDRRAGPGTAGSPQRERQSSRGVSLGPLAPKRCQVSAFAFLKPDT
jgi:2-oxoglutarate dehydrogenase complex dehydrogenase (E1) component-like enzyme